MSDGGCDPAFAFEDLGNAVRKIALDLGVAIRFYGVTALKNRAEEERVARCCPSGKARIVKNKHAANREDDEGRGQGPALYAVGTIDYGKKEDAKADLAPGIILYVKAAYHRDVVRNVGVRSYAIANPAFPHQSTGDQFFSESQFESYRALGFELMDDILSRGAALLRDAAEPTLEGIMTALRDQAVRAGVP